MRGTDFATAKRTASTHDDLRSHVHVPVVALRVPGVRGRARASPSDRAESLDSDSTRTRTRLEKYSRRRQRAHGIRLSLCLSGGRVVGPLIAELIHGL